MIAGLVEEMGSNGDLVLVCAKCHTLPEETYGAPNQGQGAYILSCGTCGQLFGQWNTPNARAAALQALAKRPQKK